MSIRKLTRQILPLLENEFDKSLFEASLANLRDEANLLRINNFCYVLRSLVDYMLTNFSPQAKIQSCEWFNGGQYGILKTGKKLISRADQLKYAIQHGVDDAYISTNLDIDIKASVKRLMTAYSKLNSYTHIQKGTYGVKRTEANKTIVEILQALFEFLSLINRFKDGLVASLEECIHASARLQSEYDEIPALAKIADHYTINETLVEEYEIKSIDEYFIHIISKGTVNVIHQRESMSPKRRGNSRRMNKTYPFICDVYFYCIYPADWDEEQSDFKVVI